MHLDAGLGTAGGGGVGVGIVSGEQQACCVLVLAFLLFSASIVSSSPLNFSIGMRLDIYIVNQEHIAEGLDVNGVGSSFVVEP